MENPSDREEFIPPTPLSEASAPADPLRLFDDWLKEATDAGLRLPNAMTLATASASGAPSARVVLLKCLDGGGFVFYTSYRSRKARELAERPRASLVFPPEGPGLAGSGRRRPRAQPRQRLRARSQDAS